MNKKKNFYVYGKYFDTFEELMEYDALYLGKKLDEDTLKELLGIFSKNIKINFFRAQNLTYREMSDILFSEFINVMEQIDLQNKNESP